MKNCSKCKQDLPFSDFSFINKQENKLHYQCNICRRKTAKASYVKHKASTVAKVIGRNKQKRDWFQDIKSRLSCCVCGESDPACLDFHHIDPTQKDFELSAALKTTGRPTLIKEMNKCACLCANCHRKEHAGRLNAPLVKLEITQSYEV